MEPRTPTASATRRFWQIHLSTAVVLTLITGALVGLNCIPDGGLDEQAYGWPIPVVKYLGKLPARPTSGWPLWFDIVSSLLILMYARTVWEHLSACSASRARLLHGRSYFFVGLATTIVCFLNFYPRTPHQPVHGAIYGWPMAVDWTLYYEFKGPVSEWEVTHLDQSDALEREFPGRYTSEVNVDEKTNEVHVLLRSDGLNFDKRVPRRVNAVSAALLIATALIVSEWALRRREHARTNRYHLLP